MMITVTRMLTVFMMKVKSKYLAIRGNTREVGGKILETSSRNTTSESKIEIPSVTWNILKLKYFFNKNMFQLTFSPASAGR